MLVVHGLWLATDRLALWGEDSTLPPEPPRRPGRQPRVRQHPFAVEAQGLADLLAASFGAAAGKATTGSVVVALPTAGRAPCDSPELVRVDPPASDGAVVELAPWRVPTLEYDPDGALDVLRVIGPAGGATDGDAVLGSARGGADGDAVLGADVRHLIAVADFAGDLVIRGRVLPSIDDGPDGPVAVWLPVVTGADAVWAQSLARALPPVGRSELTAVGRPASEMVAAGRAASEVVTSAIDGLVDAAVRTALDGHRLAGGAGRAKGTRARGTAVRGAAARGATARGAGGGGAGGAGLSATVRAWLAALSGWQRRFAAEPEAVAELSQELSTWQRDATGGSVRACFRLIEPEEPAEASDDPDQSSETAANPRRGESGRGESGRGASGRGDAVAGPAADGRWRVEFALQATDEPSLVVDAGRVWQSRGVLRALARHVTDPQETLLSELGRASRLWPELDSALRTARPAVMEMDASAAHAFLRDRAQLLAAAGFGVLLPSWWSRPSARLGVRLTAKTSTSRQAPGTVAGRSAIGLEAIVNCRWEVALGDTALTEAELRALAKLKAPLVKLRGQWVELDPSRLAAGLKLLKTRGRMTVGDLLRTGLSEQDGPGGLPVLGVRAEGPLGDLLSGAAERRLVPVEEPADFVGQLRPYQRRGLAWLHFLQALGLGGVLADDMGLGKTVQLLALLAADPPDAGPTLLVCPMSLVGNWQREAERFAPRLRVHVHHGAERARGKRFAAVVGQSDLVITTYSLAARDAEALGAIEWLRVVVDEAQAIKNAATRQAGAVRALPARHRIALTGTPVENRLADLWSIMEFANPGLLGTAASFKRRYAEPVERHGDEQAAGRLRQITGPFVLRRVKTDKSIISDLPEKFEMEVLCNLTAEQASLYQAVVDDALARIENSEGIERRGLVLATMTKLKQVCNHPAQLLHDGSRFAGRSGKLARLEEILEEVLAAGEKALLFTQYAEFGGALRAHLSARFGRETLFLHGGVGKADRDAMVTRFQQSRRPADADGPDDGPALFVLSLKAGGTGLTLTAANHVIHVDRWWNPAVEDQATDRAFRIGQRRAVQVRKFVCAGTVEEKISAMIGQKRGLAAKIVGTGEQWLTELSTAQLRELFVLEAGAVVE